MKQITADDFRKAVDLDPAWASKLTEPVEITDFCNMGQSPITHLSHLLHFSGLEHQRNCADFWGCKKLKVAEGTFRGHVEFTNSGVEKIGELNILGSNTAGNAAAFNECVNLKEARGSFPGRVSFLGSNIAKITDLEITKPNNHGHLAKFECTPIMEENPTGVVTKIFGKATINELKEIKKKVGFMEGSQDQMTEAIEKQIQYQIETAMKKNAAVEIQID